MLNIEKYKEEILKYTGKQYSMMCLIHEDIMKKNDCTGDCSKCRRETIEWLTSESKEPVLTEKEKAYLKNVIEPLNVVVDYIRKCENYTSKNNTFYTVVVRVKRLEISNHSYELINFVVTDDMQFEGMELKKRYTSEELGL